MGTLLNIRANNQLGAFSPLQERSAVGAFGLSLLVSVLSTLKYDLELKLTPSSV